MARFTVPPFQFVRPLSQLPEDLKEAVKDLDRHGFCILDAELLQRRFLTASVLEMFREACRRVSIEKDRNLVQGEIRNLSEGALAYLAERTEQPYAEGDFAVLLDRANAPGTVNEDEYVEDEDGKGILEETGQTITVKPE